MATRALARHRWDADDPSPDAEVIARIRGGELALIEVLVRRNGRPLYRISRVWARDEGAAIGRMVKACVAVCSELVGRIDGGSSSVAAASAMGPGDGSPAFRAALLRHVADGPRTVRECGARPYGAPGFAPAGRAAGAADILLRTVEQSVQALPVTARAAFMLRDVEALSIGEVAHILRLTPDNVRVRLHRARRKLRRLLASDLLVLVPSSFPVPDGVVDRVVEEVLVAVATRVS